MELTSALATKIRQVIRSCGQEAKLLAVEDFQVSEKGMDDYVTSVDQALDRQLTEQFSALFPTDGIITEENEASRKYFQEAFERLWCIDPLDGTKDFINGDRNYAVLVGLLKQKRAIAGWMYAPEYDLMYFGGEGLGVWKVQGDGEAESCVRSEPDASSSCRVLIGDTDYHNYGEKISAAIPDVDFVKSPGSFGLKVMDVVLGKADVYVYFNQRVKLWDTVSSIALARAAGLTCCDLDGKPLDYTNDVMNLETLAHQQSIVIGWASYVESLLPQLRAVIL
jgi:3'(2'), 5'-bisphosphate nucleotidase